MDKKQTLNLLEIFWSSEIVADSLYSSLAARCSDDNLKKSIIKIGEMERGHANVWNKIAKDVHSVSFRVSIFLKIKISLMKLFSFILPFTIFIHYMEHEERNAILEYSKLLDTYRGNENIRRIISNIIKQEISHEWHMMEQITDKEFYIEKAREAMDAMTYGNIETLGLVIGLLAAHSTTEIIGLTGIILTMSGAIGVMSISYVSSKAYHDLYKGRTKEIHIKKEIDPGVLRTELENILMNKGISSETTRLVIDLIGVNPVVLSDLVKTFKIAGEAGVPKESAKTTGIFFIMGTLPILAPFFIGAMLHSGPLIPTIIASAMAVIIISVSGFFIAVLSGEKILKKIVHNIFIIVGTCTLTYLIGFAVRTFFGFVAGH